jgi:hypothetical protein
MRFIFAIPIVFMTLAGCQSQSSDSGASIIATAAATPAKDMLEQTVDDRFVRIMNFARAERLYEKEMGEIVQVLGERLIGAPYKAGMLDEPAEERLIARLDAFDCVLFVEAALAMAQGVAVEDYSYDTYLRNLETLRYRGGNLEGYASRLHYFTEWIIDNEERGSVEDISREIGGERLAKRLNFMSSNRGSYPRFKTNNAVFDQVKQMEARLAGHEIYFVPQNRIRSVYGHLQAGDIIALATSINGLDVTHTGLAFRNTDGTFGLLHASTTGQVLVSPDLQAYVENNRSQIGIVVTRPLRPVR